MEKRFSSSWRKEKREKKMFVSNANWTVNARSTIVPEFWNLPERDTAGN
jgi:hypothetical protein